MPYTNFHVMVPHHLRDEGNNFFGVTGMSMADINSYPPSATEGRYRRIDDHSKTFHINNLYDDWGFESKISAPLVRPVYDTEEVLDVEAAQTLLDNAIMYPTYNEETAPEAAPTQMVIATLGAWQTLLALYGLEVIPE